MTIEDVLHYVGLILVDERYPPGLKLWLVRKHVVGYDDETLKRRMEEEKVRTS